jgi:hypothetical protein
VRRINQIVCGHGEIVDGVDNIVHVQLLFAGLLQKYHGVGERAGDRGPFNIIPVKSSWVYAGRTGSAAVIFWDPW